MNLCQANGIAWPFDINTVSTKSFICFDGMLPREREVAVITDLLWPARDDDDTMHFMDVNPTLQRLVQHYLDDEGKAIPGRGPWHEQPGTLVGSGKVVVRYKPVPQRPGHNHDMRLLEAFEYMRMIGWDDSFWSQDVSYTSVKELTTT